MYPYHYPHIGKALVLVFSAEPFLRPIRPHRWPEYSWIVPGLEKEVTAP